MIRILFVCHGNICRSPMAEFIMADLVKKHSLDGDILVSSKATSYEEIGNGMDERTIKVLCNKNIEFDENKMVSVLTRSDYDKYDYIIGMDEENIRDIFNILNVTEHKVYKLLYFADIARDIDDPWYTGNFERAYQDIYLGCTSFLTYLISRHKLYAK